VAEILVGNLSKMHQIADITPKLRIITIPDLAGQASPI
jgi:hypothetical protein